MIKLKDGRGGGGGEFIIGRWERRVGCRGRRGRRVAEWRRSSPPRRWGRRRRRRRCQWVAATTPCSWVARNSRWTRRRWRHSRRSSPWNRCSSAGRRFAAALVPVWSAWRPRPASRPGGRVRAHGTGCCCCSAAGSLNCSQPAPPVTKIPINFQYFQNFQNFQNFNWNQKMNKIPTFNLWITDFQWIEWFILEEMMLIDWFRISSLDGSKRRENLSGQQLQFEPLDGFDRCGLYR